MDKGLFPKLGDLPDPIPDAANPKRTLDWLASRMNSVLELASKTPVAGPAPNTFVSPQFSDWLKNDSEPEAAEVRNFIRDGVPLTQPSFIGPITDSAGTSPQEHDTCTVNELLKGCSNGYLGPFPYSGQKFVEVHYTDIFGNPKISRNLIKTGPAFRVIKSKRRMKYAGRLVTDLKRNLLNADYSPEDCTVAFPTFQELASTSRGMAYMFIVDFVAAYRQIRYSYSSWGFVSILFRGKLFVDIAITFGWGPAAKCFQMFSRTLIRNLCFYWPELFLEIPVFLPNNTSQLFVDPRNRHRAWIDDLKFVSSSFLKCSNMMSKLKEVASKFNIILDFSPTGDSPVQEGTYTGWVYSLIEQAVKFPLPKRAKIIRMINCLISGKTWSTTVSGEPISRPPKLFTKRELSSLHGSLNHFSLAHRSVFRKLTPLIRISNTVPNLEDLIRISYESAPWLFKSLTEILEIVHQNRWVSFDEISLPLPRSKHYSLTFADAAGQDDADSTFGIGGLSYTARFAFQIPHHIVLPFLQELHDRNPFRAHIINTEHLVQLFTVWYGFETKNFEPNSIIELRTDNSVVCAWWRKTRCRYSAQSFMLDAILDLAHSHGCQLNVTWISTELMKLSGADSLSRERLHSIQNLPVEHISQKLFNKFSSFFPRYATISERNNHGCIPVRIYLVSS